MDRVVGTDEQVGTGAHQLLRGFKQHLAHRTPIIEVDQALIGAKREIVQRDLGMRIWAKQVWSFKTDGPIAERGASHADRYDSNVFHACAPSRNKSGCQLAAASVRTVAILLGWFRRPGKFYLPFEELRGIASGPDAITARFSHHSSAAA